MRPEEWTGPTKCTSCGVDADASHDHPILFVCDFSAAEFCERVGYAALDVAVIALTTSPLMWLVAFLDVGGEWFLMWQSKMWNGQEEAFRMFAVVGLVFLIVVQGEPDSVSITPPQQIK